MLLVSDKAKHLDITIVWACMQFFHTRSSNYRNRFELIFT